MARMAPLGGPANHGLAHDGRALDGVVWPLSTRLHCTGLLSLR